MELYFYYSITFRKIFNCNFILIIVNFFENNIVFCINNQSSWREMELFIITINLMKHLIKIIFRYTDLHMFILCFVFFVGISHEFSSFCSGLQFITNCTNFSLTQRTSLTKFNHIIIITIVQNILDYNITRIQHFIIFTKNNLIPTENMCSIIIFC